MASPEGQASWEVGSPVNVANQELQASSCHLSPALLPRLSMLKQEATTKGRTYFLEIIAKEKDIRYSLIEQCDLLPRVARNVFCRAFSAKTRDLFCRMAKKSCVTAFARPAHSANKSYEVGCKADVKRASGDIATACLPSRLISWFEPRLPLLPLQLCPFHALLRRIPKHLL
jgi:hypothetical protein